MTKKTRRNKDWHHRVPDFKLVYCGTKKRMKEEEPKEMRKKRLKAMTKNAA
jgi:hypothetical protein